MEDRATRVLIELRSAPAIRTASVGPDLSGFVADPAYPPVRLPAGRAVALASDPATYLIRGSIGANARGVLAAHPEVVGVFSDPAIESAAVCPGDRAIGTARTVGTRLGRSALHAAKLDGRGVLLAIVDTGINLAYLRSVGRTPELDAAKSFAPARVTTEPGAHPVDHGTMCAFDAGIMAPAATLLDHAVLAPGAVSTSGLLSDAVRSYDRLRAVLGAVATDERRMVVSNSWGMFSSVSDFPPGDPGNYSDNSNHPFNRIVAALEADGADILFAAGNCGRDCPDLRCAFGSLPPICGANSHPVVLSVAAVATTNVRLGYSSQGPGRLASQKPDVAAYSHFAGSGIEPTDTGTSAACPVAAGVVAAIRSAHPASAVSPAQLRSLVQRTADDRGVTGYDFDLGWGILDPKALVAALR